MSSSSSEVHYPFRFQSFGGAVGFLVFFWIVAEILFGMLRTPIADRWQSEVVEVGLLQKNGWLDYRPLNAALELDVLDSGVVFDARPTYHQRYDGMHFDFSGADVDKLQKLGIKSGYINSREKDYKDGFCFAENESRAYSNMDLNSGAARIKIIDKSKSSEDCSDLQMDFLSQDAMNLTIYFNKNYVVRAKLKRDSRISLIQRLVMSTKTFRDTSWSYL